tara:strand:+ start:17499 stop:17663 length:165 start_codon:yes stop_codon:yes gene_type:complete
MLLKSNRFPLLIEGPKGYAAFTKGESACFLVEIPFQLKKRKPQSQRPWGSVQLF